MIEKAKYNDAGGQIYWKIILYNQIIEWTDCILYI
jgi:hypothetical protein